MDSEIQNRKFATIIIQVRVIHFSQPSLIYIDDENVANLNFIDSFKAPKYFRVRPGAHTVYVMISGLKSEALELDVKPGEEITLISGFGIPRILAVLLRRRPFLKVYKSWLESGVVLVRKVVGLGQTADTSDEQFVQESNVENQYSSIVVHFQSDSEKVQATVEEVNVPEGVEISVKRSRTCEHTIDIEQGVLRGGSFKVGLEEILGVSIRGEIEKRSGRGYHQSETVEYDVTLNGSKNEHYKLIWTDIWRTGNAEVREGDKTHMIPFRFRERTELNVTT